MKILAFDRFPAASDSAMERLTGGGTIAPGEAPACTVITDSATLRPHEPLFVPDFAEGWVLEVLPSVTVERLGKWIAPRFARRYFGDFRLCARLLPPSGSVPASALETNFDGALAWGRPHSAQELYDTELSVSASLSDGSCRHVFTFGWKELHAEETLALASRYMTLKTGDVIIPCRTSLRFPAVAGTRLQVSLGSADTLDINLKIK